MKITEISQSNLPLRVKLNSNFTLDESFDPGTIVQINSIVPDFEGCYKVWVTALAKDMDYNKSIAQRDWLNRNTNQFELDIFEANPKDIDNKGNYKDIIFVMDSDDCFDVITELDEPKYSINDILLIVSEIAPDLKPHITESNVNQFIEGLKRKK